MSLRKKWITGGKTTVQRCMFQRQPQMNNSYCYNKNWNTNLTLNNINKLNLVYFSADNNRKSNPCMIFSQFTANKLYISNAQKTIADSWWEKVKQNIRDEKCKEYECENNTMLWDIRIDIIGSADWVCCRCYCFYFYYVYLWFCDTWYVIFVIAAVATAQQTLH